jgi:late competence protein required for DNA uptake (superfamily II DNA/RNA helicase)
MKPQWKHDCTACTYIGSMHMHNHTADWYVCSGSVIARRSDDGPDYWSMPTDMVTDNHSLTNWDGVIAHYHMRVLAQFMLTKHKKEQA